MTISTREQLKNHVHSIHDYLRNSGAGYGMTAMKIFGFLYGLKTIQPLIENPALETQLNKELCKFSNLKDLMDNGENGLGGEMGITSRMMEILEEIKKETKLVRYLYYHLPEHLKNTVWEKLIDLVNEIPTKMDANYNENVNLSGKVYEYFIGRDATAISELGAYFTDRHITNYVINKVKPTIYEGKIVKSMIDPFGGSGGFTLGYLEYLNKEKKIQKEDWMNENKSKIQNYKKIHHYDMNEDVIKIAGLEFFTFTDKFPEKNKFVCTNTFKHEFDQQYEYIFTNPPYGGDKTEKSTESIDNEKIIEYVKNILNELNEQYIGNTDYINMINKIGIKGKHKKNISEYTTEDLDKILVNLDSENDDELIDLIQDVRAIVGQMKDLKNKNAEYCKEQEDKQVNYSTCSNFLRKYMEDNKLENCNDKEACSLVLLMALLKEKGTCAGVLKEGVFFDNKYASVRGHLMKKFNVKYVVSIPADQFENTTTKTSALIFDNTPSIETNEVIFYDLEVVKEPDDVYEKSEDRTYGLIKKKGDIINVIEKEVAKATVKEICSPTIEKTKSKNKETTVEKYYYSLSAKRYDQKLKNIECDEKYKLVKLGDICEINPKSEIVNGNYNYVEISDIENNNIINYIYDSIDKLPQNAKHIAKYNDILISTVRPKKSKCLYVSTCIDNIEKYIFSGGLALLRMKNTICNQMYIYSLLLEQVDSFERTLCEGSTYPRFKAEQLKEIKIPIPKTEKLLKEWTEKISKPYNEMNEKKQKYEKLEKEVQTEVQRIIDEEDCDQVMLGDVCDLQDGYDFYKNERDSDKYYKVGKNYPLLKVSANEITDYVIINDKFKKYEIIKNIIYNL